GRGYDTDVDFSQVEFGGDRESLATVEHGALRVDLERFDDPTPGDVGAQRLPCEPGERRQMLVRVCPQLAWRGRNSISSTAAAVALTSRSLRDRRRRGR